MTDRTTQAGHGGLALERLVFFSDAVFAIAITLLVLEIEVPHLARDGGLDQFAEAMIELFPKFFAFGLSFLVIGRFWMSHHQLFGHVVAYSPRLMWPNVFYLMAIAFMPFSTALLGTNLSQFGPAMFYNLTLLATASVGWVLVRRIRELAVADAPLAREANGAFSVILGAATSVLLTFVAPQFSQMGMVTIPLWIRLLNRKLPA